MTETSFITFPSPAKLNLFLHIVGRRENGYHDLETVFQFLDYGDTIEITATKSQNVATDSRCYSRRTSPFLPLIFLIKTLISVLVYLFICVLVGQM